jgi:hypothetical protein
LRRNVELEGPMKFEGYEDKEIYHVWFDCDCGRRVTILASPTGPFEMRLGTKTYATRVWKLILNGERLSTAPSILFPNHRDGQSCHVGLSDEPFKISKIENEDE